MTWPGGAARPAGPSGPSGTASLAAQLVVIAKAPVPGRVKTRLTPPFSPEQAARLAAAALADTLAAAAATRAARAAIALDGEPGDWLPPGFLVTLQRGRGLDERIAAALGDAYARRPLPVALIGMDTPQVTPGLLDAALRPLADGSADAVFGPATDGGFWLLGLRRPDPALVLGVPMSTAGTGAAQLARLTNAGLRVHHLPERTDVDSAAEAVAVALAAPRSRFAATLRGMLAPPATAPSRPGRELAGRAGRELAGGASAGTGRRAAAGPSRPGSYGLVTGPAADHFRGPDLGSFGP